MWASLCFFRAPKASTYTQHMNQAAAQHTQEHTQIKLWNAFATSAHKTHSYCRCCILSDSPQTAISKSRCLKQTLLWLHFINSLNSRVSLNYSCFKSIRRPHCSILLERSSPKITMSSLCIVEKTYSTQPSIGTHLFPMLWRTVLMGAKQSSWSSNN